MKKDIHPPYKESTVTCACGAKFSTKSTVESMHIEICSQCHPLFTGKQKLIDTTGRVEKFRLKYANSKKGKKGKAKSE